MSQAITSFAQIIDPVTPEAFFAEYHDRKPLHVPGDPRRFAGIMSWPILNDLLNKTALWSATSLQLVLDNQVVAPARYCHPATDRNNLQVMQPDAVRVSEQLRQGASLVANDIDTLTPELAAVGDALDAALGGKAQANLYCSWRERQAFASHFDTHDVFALHVEGHKMWRVYQTRVDRPIAHPRFKSSDQAHHDRAKGRVAREIEMRPGDLLYLPRGQYHDALASSEASIHVTFGVTAVIGIDFLDLVRELAIDDPLFRGNVPAPSIDTAEKVTAHLEHLAERLGEIAGGAEARDRFRAFQRGFHYPRGGFALPDSAMAKVYRVRAQGLEVRRTKDGWALIGRAGAVPIPPGGDRLVAWVIAREGFSDAEIEAAFPDTAAAHRGRMLRDMARMKVIEPV